MRTLLEQLRQEMIKQGVGHCDAVEFVLDPTTVITSFTADDPVLAFEFEVQEIRLYERYVDYLAR